MLKLTTENVIINKNAEKIVTVIIKQTGKKAKLMFDLQKAKGTLREKINKKKYTLK